MTAFREAGFALSSGKVLTRRPQAAICNSKLVSVCASRLSPVSAKVDLESTKFLVVAMMLVMLIRGREGGGVVAS